MRKVVLGAATVAGLLTAASGTSAVWSQGAPKSCSEAYSACALNKHLSKQCEEEKQWCIKTGTFADPKTKAATINLQKK